MLPKAFPMSSLSPSISIHTLRCHVLRNGDRSSSACAKPVFRNARRFHASPAPRGRPAPVNVDSLVETLENHRLANAQCVIRKVDGGKRTGLTGWGPLTRPVYKPAPQSTSTSTSDNTSSVSLKLEEKKKKEKEEHIVGPRVIRQVSDGPSRDTGIVAKLDKAKGDKIDEPWLDFTSEHAPSGLARLDDEIRAFTTYMRSIPVEEDAAQKLQQQLSDTLSAAGLPRPLLFGSRKTGMALRHSNVNMMIPLEDPDGSASSDDFSGRGPSDTRPKISELQSVYLDNAFHVLEHNPQFSHCRLPLSRVPRLHATHLPTGLPVSIQAGVKLPTADDYVMNYVAEYPTLPQLFTILRMILETRAIFGQANRTATSYGLIMMIVGALKLGEGTFDRHSDLGQQLLHVLRFYGYANFRRYGISVEPPSLFRKKDPRNVIDPNTAPAHVRGQISIGKRSAALREAIVCLQDPANYMHDLGQSFFRTLEVQGLFRHLVLQIEGGVLAWDMKNSNASAEEFSALGRGRIMAAEKVREEAEAEGRPMSILRPAVGGNYDFIERIRDKTVLALA